MVETNKCGFFIRNLFFIIIFYPTSLLGVYTLAKGQPSRVSELVGGGGRHCHQGDQPQAHGREGRANTRKGTVAAWSGDTLRFSGVVGRPTGLELKGIVLGTARLAVRGGWPALPSSVAR